MVNSIERKIIHKLKQTQRAFDTNVAEERLKLIEDCLNKSIGIFEITNLNISYNMIP